jgi:hypothetical protein
MIHTNHAGRPPAPINNAYRPASHVLADPAGSRPACVLTEQNRQIMALRKPFKGMYPLRCVIVVVFIQTIKA